MHPFFWNVDQLIALEDRIRSFSANRKSVQRVFDENQTVFEGEWTDFVDGVVVKACMHEPGSPPNSNPTSPQPTSSSTSSQGNKKSSPRSSKTSPSISPRPTKTSTLRAAQWISPPHRQNTKPPFIAPSKITFTGLCAARRNRRQHCDEDDKVVKEKMGSLPKDCFDYWEDRFPKFQLHLFLRSLKVVYKGRRIYELRDFTGYYKASPKFYRACANVDID